MGQQWHMLPLSVLPCTVRDDSTMPTSDSTIQDVIWKSLQFYKDPRGWLCELFRNDDVPEAYRPVMAYLSMTEPGISRGPHEHVEQADYFCFVGPGTFRVYLWDARPASPTFGVKEVRDVGVDAPFALIVPPGVVHAYKNISSVQGWVFNAANALYAGEGRQGWRGPKGTPDYVDEIRHEQQADSPYLLD